MLSGCIDGTEQQHDWNHENTQSGADSRPFYILAADNVTPGAGSINESWELTVPDDLFDRFHIELRFAPRVGQDEWRFEDYRLTVVKPDGSRTWDTHFPRGRGSSEPYLAYWHVCTEEGTCRPEQAGVWAITLTAAAGSDAHWQFLATLSY